MSEKTVTDCEQNSSPVMNAADRLGTEPVSKLLLKFSIPAITGMVVNALYNVVDRIFIGHAVSEIALGGIALVMPLMTIGFAFAMLFGFGATNMISMRLGQGKKEEAQKTLNHCFFLLVCSSIIILIIGLIFLDTIISWMGAEEGSQALTYAKDYFRITLYGIVFFMLSFGLSHCTRAQGFPKISMIGMLLGAGLNIIFDALFILVFQWGVEGAAWATVVSQFIVTIYILFFIMSKKAVIRLKFSFFKPEPAIIFQIITFGSVQFLNQFLMSAAQLLNNMSMGWYGAAALRVENGGDIALSGMNIIGAVLMFILMPVFGISQGVQPILGYNYGAKKHSRVLRAYLGAIAAATLVCTVGFIAAMIFPVQLVRLFTPEGSDAIMHFAPRAMRIMMLLLPLAGFQVISANLFIVTGRPKISIFLSMLRQCIALIPCILIFGRVWGLWGVIAAAPVADFITLLVTGVFIFFELGKLRSKSLQ